MNFISKIKKFLGFGGEKVSKVKTLEKLTDHPKINMSDKEVRRIEEDFKYYAGKYEKVKFINSMGQERERDFFYLNMTKKVAEYMSSLVFNEQCEITIDDDEANRFIQDIFDRGDFKGTLTGFLEPMFAVGGLMVKPYYNVYENRIDYSWCLADTIYPLKSKNNKIKEVAVANVTSKNVGNDIYYYTHLEFHEWLDNGSYQITNELYASKDVNKVGRRVPLNELYEGLQEVTVVNYLSKPLFAYLKPAGFNNLEIHSPLGLGLCDNAKKTLEIINETYDLFRWEVKQGKRRVITSDHFLRNKLDSDGNIIQYFDEDTDVYVALAGGIDDMTYQDITSPIRSDQFIETINKHLSTLEMETNLSAGTFTFDGKSIKTATEVVTENTTTYQTRNKHVLQVSKFIKDLIISTFELGVAVGLYTGKIPKYENIGIDFNDGVFADKNSQLEFLSKATLNGFMPKAEAIQRLFDIPEDEALEWLQRINDEALSSDVDYQVIKEEREILG